MTTINGNLLLEVALLVTAHERSIDNQVIDVFAEVSAVLVARILDDARLGRDVVFLNASAVVRVINKSVGLGTLSHVWADALTVATGLAAAAPASVTITVAIATATSEISATVAAAEAAPSAVTTKAVSRASPAVGPARAAVSTVTAVSDAITVARGPAARRRSRPAATGSAPPLRLGVYLSELVLVSLLVVLLFDVFHGPERCCLAVSAARGEQKDLLNHVSHCEL